MTRKDYIKIAAILRSARTINTGNSKATVESFIMNIQNDLCGVFREDNDRFDEDRFRDAANLEIK